jgi:hypothetical protein
MSKNSSHAPKDYSTPRGFGSSLCRARRAPANADEIWTMRKRAWRESGVVMVRPEEINDPFARQAVINAASALYGPRPRDQVNTMEEAR